MRSGDEDKTVGIWHDVTGHSRPIAIDDHHSEKPKEKLWNKILDWSKGSEHDGDDVKRKEWLENMRGMLSVASTMISTITFQCSVNPPGGVLQANGPMTNVELKKCASNNSLLCPGEAVMPILSPDEYFHFLLFNTICFVTSLCVTLLLVSGIPLNHRLPMWILSIGMILTLTLLALTYLHAVALISPGVDVFRWERTTAMAGRATYATFGLVGVISLFLAFRFSVWLVNKCIKKFKDPK